MKLITLIKDITTYFLYHTLQLSVVFLATQYSLYQGATQLFLTFLQTSLIFLTLSAHFSMYFGEKKWHWLTPSTIGFFLFPSENKNSQEVAIYFQLFACMIVLSFVVTSTLILCLSAQISQTLFVSGRLWILMRSINYLKELLQPQLDCFLCRDYICNTPRDVTFPKQKTFSSRGDSFGHDVSNPVGHDVSANPDGPSSSHPEMSNQP